MNCLQIRIILTLGFPHFVLYSISKLGVTFALRCFHDVISLSRATKYNRSIFDRLEIVVGLVDHSEVVVGLVQQRPLTDQK